MRLPTLLLLTLLATHFTHPQTSAPAFDAATIKPAAPSPDGHTHINYPPGPRFSAINITLLDLMQWAYDTPSRQILDGPPWLASTRFDIVAESDPDQPSPSAPVQPPASSRKRLMVQALLAERFNIKLHPETRSLPAYDLVLAKGGSKLLPSKSNGHTTRSGRTYFHGEGLTPTIIAEQLSDLTGRVVVDRTGLDGRFDLDLRWTPDDAPATTDSSTPTLFTAIEEQLGLKLKSAKEPVPVLIIDHIDPPTPN